MSFFTDPARTPSRVLRSASQEVEGDPEGRACREDNAPMRIEHHNWVSPRLGWDMGVAVFGHWGPPLLAFPTSHGDQWELQRQGLLDAIADFIDAGRSKCSAWARTTTIRS